MIRLSWHDAGVFNGQNGCPNAAMRLAGGGEYAFGANAGDGPVRTEPGRSPGVMAGNIRSQCVFGIKGLQLGSFVWFWLVIPSRR